ncbi:MAG: hypothetical protein HYV55_01065 [Parcubacteria group bacterium]|nr:hypothetical protein [Parcubacteria group bacterium]
MKILILGRGAMGEALGSLLIHNHVPFEYANVDDIPPRESPTIVFIAVPVQHIREALKKYERIFSKETIFINCAKGIERNTLLFPYQIVAELFSPKEYYSLIGPSFAAEILEKEPTYVNLGYSKKGNHENIIRLLQTSYFRIEGTRVFQYLELAGALKNVYAIASGFAASSGYKMNTRAFLITRALQEIEEASQTLHYECPPLALPGVEGDLILTCFSEESRNFRFGSYLAALPPQEALEKAGVTVEGYFTSKIIQELSSRYGVVLPLASLVEKLIENGNQSKAHFAKFVETLGYS